MNDYKKLKTLFIYQEYREGVGRFYERHIKKLNEHGFHVEGFCITLKRPGPRHNFPELDRKWKRNDNALMQKYEALKIALRDKEVLVLFNGADLHPGFLKEIETFNAYMCFDDPESSQNLSQPVAKYFDACFVGNIASMTQYQSWGCKHTFFRPLGFFDSYVNEAIKNKSNWMPFPRDIDISLFCERESAWRKERIAFIADRIPQIYGRGRGWPEGYASDDEMLTVYARSKIGLNIHNSTGPINLRTYVLPANGVMQICDNKYFLGHIFELHKEVVGYCDTEEVPELVNYYLHHDTQRNEIAYSGWKRAWREYNEVAVWDRQMRQIGGLI